MRFRILGQHKPHINRDPQRGYHPWVCRWHSHMGPTFYGRGQTPAKAWAEMQANISQRGYASYAPRG